MLHLARKAFDPAPPPFPLMHVDTTWKFREMIAFRDRMAAEARHATHRPHQPGRASTAGLNPFDHGPNSHARDEDRGAEAGARPAQVRCRLRRRAARRGEEPRQGAHLLLPLRQPRLGPEEPAPGALAALQHARPRRASRCACSRSPIGPSSTSGPTSCAKTSRSCRSTSPPSGRSWTRNGQLIMVDDDRMPLAPGEEPETAAGPLPHARLLPAHRRDRIDAPRRSRRSWPR